MGYHEICYGADQSINRKWLHQVQPELFKFWVAETKHRPGAAAGTLACRIKSNRGPRHQALPCAMLQEANEVGLFLSSTCFNDNPVAFFRLYAFLLDELTERMRSTAKLVLQKPFAEQPRSISIWGNVWAKHRLKILLQHHPCIIFLDRVGVDEAKCRQQLEAERAQDRCGNDHPVRVIDQQSLGQLEGTNWEADGRDEWVVVIVPPLRTLLADAIDYFKNFVALCQQNSEALVALESDRFLCGCF